MAQKQYEYDGIIRELPDNGGACVLFPWDIREEFGKGRVKVHAEFDGIADVTYKNTLQTALFRRFSPLRT